MINRLIRPILMALAASISPSFLDVAHAVGDMAPSMAMPSRERSSLSTAPPAQPAESPDRPMDHSRMGHAPVSAMDRSMMNMDNQPVDEMHSMGTGAAGTSRMPIRLLTEADRTAAFAPVAGHRVHDKSLNTFMLLDQFEYQDADNGSTLNWDAKGWIGGYIDRLWLRSEGERTNGATQSAEFQALWGHAISPWWDVVTGVRQDFKPGSPKTWGAFGIQGMALYNFEAQATTFIDEHGQAAARFEGNYDILLSNRLILQPIVETNFYGKNDPRRGIGSGLANTDVGLRLRYEIIREFAPYIGVSWNRTYGKTADLAREEGEQTNEAKFVVGIRMWF